MPGNCRLWVGAAGGGVWRTDDALAADPSWTYLTGGIAQNSVGALTADPNDSSGNTLYLGTGEANRCSSGCEAGVGIYKTTNGGNNWTKLADTCVSNATYACVTPGTDAFLGRSIGKILVDPTDPKHIYAASALGVRGLSHVIGLPGETQRFPPGANSVGAVRIDRWREHVHRGLERQRLDLWSEGRSTRPARSADGVRVGVRPGSLAPVPGARRFVVRRTTSTKYSHPGIPAAGPTA